MIIHNDPSSSVSVMLVTSLYRWLFSLRETDLRFWWQNHYAGHVFHYVGGFLNVFNQSPITQTCHQHIWSPTSVTNIDVTTISPHYRLKSIPAKCSLYHRCFVIYRIIDEAFVWPFLHKYKIIPIWSFLWI